MITSQSKNLLIEIIIETGKLEQSTEEYRKSLAQQQLFEPFTAFKRIDRKGKKKIDQLDIQQFLKDNRVLDNYRDIHYYIEIYDVEGKGGLDYTDFLRSVLTFTEQDARTQVAQRKNYDIKPNETLAFKVERTLTDMIVNEIKSLKNIAQLRLNLFQQEGLNISNLFYCIDKEKLHFLDYDCILSFLLDKSVISKDVLSELVVFFIRRINREDNGKIYLNEFSEFLSNTPHAQKKISPSNNNQEIKQAVKEIIHRRAQSSYSHLNLANSNSKENYFMKDILYHQNDSIVKSNNNITTTISNNINANLIKSTSKNNKDNDSGGNANLNSDNNNNNCSKIEDTAKKSYLVYQPPETTPNKKYTNPWETKYDSMKKSQGLKPFQQSLAITDYKQYQQQSKIEEEHINDGLNESSSELNNKEQKKSFKHRLLQTKAIRTESDNFNALEVDKQSAIKSQNKYELFNYDADKSIKSQQEQMAKMQRNCQTEIGYQQQLQQQSQGELQIHSQIQVYPKYSSNIFNIIPQSVQLISKSNRIQKNPIFQQIFLNIKQLGKLDQELEVLKQQLETKMQCSYEQLFNSLDLWGNGFFIFSQFEEVVLRLIGQKNFSQEDTLLLFKRFDIRNEGKINFHQFINMIAPKNYQKQTKVSISLNIEAEIILKQLFKQLVENEGVAEIIKQKIEKEGIVFINDVFKALDFDNDGVITLNDINQGFQFQDIKLTPDDCIFIRDYFDRFKQGFISFAEFIKEYKPKFC